MQEESTRAEESKAGQEGGQHCCSDMSAGDGWYAPVEVCRATLANLTLSACHLGLPIHHHDPVGLNDLTSGQKLNGCVRYWGPG